MAKGHKTGGRQKGTRNKATVRLDAKLAEAAGWATAGLSTSEVASISPLDVMQYATGLSCSAGTGDRRPRSPRRRLHTSTQRWLRGRTVAMATTKSRSRSSEGCRNSKPVPTVADGVYLRLFIYFLSTFAGGGEFSPISSVLVPSSFFRWKPDTKL